MRCIQLINLSLIVFCLICSCALTQAQTTSFTYQGKLTDGGGPANGPYHLQVKLFDTPALNSGTQIGSTLTFDGAQGNQPAVVVTNGVFTVQLDFGANAFPGADRFLEIGVKRPADSSYTPLTPRQPVSSNPYAIKSKNAATADTATNSTQLGGVAANQYVQTNDSRLSDARNPLSGSASYIQNGTAPQPTSNFNISGNGVLAGTLRVAGNVGIGTTASPNGLQAGVSVSETPRGEDNVRLGVSSGTPRVILEDATFTQWQLDNFAGRFRIFTPGIERFAIDSSGNVEVSGNIKATGTVTGPRTNMVTATAPITPGATPTLVPGLSQTVVVSGNAKLLVHFGVSARRGLCVGCDASTAVIYVVLNGVVANEVRATVSPDSQVHISGIWLMSVAAGNHTVEIKASTIGASVVYAGVQNSAPHSNLIVQVIPE